MSDARKTQTERMRDFFLAHAGEKIPCFYFAMNMGILQYGRCIKELRDAGMDIENGCDDFPLYPSGVRKNHWFRYTPSFTTTLTKEEVNDPHFGDAA